MNRRIVVVACIVSAAGAVGCASSTQPAVSGAVRELHGVDCPDDGVQVLDTRDAGEDTIYVVDACGKKLEITQGFAIPERKSQLSEFSAESPLELPKDFKRVVPGGVTDAVRHKVPHWCRAPSRENPDAIAFSGQTLAECRARLLESLNPIGTEPGPYGEADIYWFMLGKYVFTVRQSFSTAGAPDRQVATKTTPSFKRKEQIWYARAMVGPGYLVTTGAGSSYAGGSFGLHGEVGLKVTSDLAFGFLWSGHRGLTSDSNQPYILENALAADYFPVSENGFHLGANAGIGLVAYGFDGYSSVGAVVGGTLGYDFGSRSKERKGNWSGFSMALHGFYLFDDAGGGKLYLGWYAW